MQAAIATPGGATLRVGVAQGNVHKPGGPVREEDLTEALLLPWWEDEDTG